MSCTRSTCRCDVLKRKRYCCSSSSSIPIIITKRQQCHRIHAPPPPPPLEEGSQAHEYCDGSIIWGSQSHCDWSGIGTDALEHVYKTLSLADILRCRAVCSWWRCVSQTHISSSLNSPPTATPPPILWCQPDDDDSSNHDQFMFLDVVAKEDVGNLYLPNHESKQFLDQMETCVGYSFGYFLLTLRNQRNRLCLLRPLSRLCLLRPLSSPTTWTVSFPPISVSDDEEYGFRKAVLWADPISSTSSCGVVAVHYGCDKLLFAKCGATEFAELECQRPHDTPCTEIVCINNIVFGISFAVEDHRIEAWDCSSCGKDGPRKVFEFQPTFSSGHIPLRRCTFHLVESQGELLLVAIKRLTRGSQLTSPKIPTCKVYKMDFKEKKWVHMDSLGDRVLFIFQNQSISLSAREFPQYKKNTIYFRHYFQGRYNPDPRLGIFNMEDGSLREIYTKTS